MTDYCRWHGYALMGQSWDRHDVWIQARDGYQGGAGSYVLRPFTPSLKPHKEGSAEEASLSVSRLDLQENNHILFAFAEAAWAIGWRPEGFKQHDLTAMQKHLEDMRELVFTRWLRKRVDG